MKQNKGNRIVSPQLFLPGLDTALTLLERFYRKQFAYLRIHLIVFESGLIDALQPPLPLLCRSMYSDK